jgi:hypothetical protein
MIKRVSIVLAFLAVAGCGDSAPPKKSAGSSPPIRTACTTPEQAGLKAGDVTRRLVEAKKAGKISQDQYDAYNVTMGQGLRAWSERDDLAAYCNALNRIVVDAALQ